MAFVMTQHKPILLLGYGNPSRGDDALGVLLLEQLSDSYNSTTGLQTVELLTDFQLQIEHALDLKNRQLVLFADASVANTKPIAFRQLHAVCDNSYTSHAMNPAAVMQVFQDIKKTAPPPCFLLTMQAVRFELGEGLSEIAVNSLQQALVLVEKLLAQPDLSAWQANIQGF
jgi:hydrogenase maturation protease